jgi:hypothetical protein
LPPTWSLILSSDAFSFITSGSRGWARYYSDEGALFIRVGNLNHDSIGLDLTSIQRVSPPANAEGRRTRVAEGDILISITADVGMVALIEAGLDEAYISQHIALARPAGNMDARYLAYFLSAKDGGQEQFLHLQRGATKAGLGLDDIRSIWIAHPPLAEQQKIVSEIERRLAATNRLAASLDQQLVRARAARQRLQQEAFDGRLVPQDPNDEPALVLLERIRTERMRGATEWRRLRHRLGSTRNARSDFMQEPSPSPESFWTAWERIGRQADARRLFDEAGFSPSHVEQFYEALRATPEVRTAFEEAAKRNRRPQIPITKPLKEEGIEREGRFRLIELWLEDFKNLKDYTIRFNPAYAVDALLGWNGTGKSNLFEALIIIFRDLHGWWEKNDWPDKPMNGYRLIYEIDEHMIEVTWRPGAMKRPELKKGPIVGKTKNTVAFEDIRREQLPLPRFIFGYYSGPSNRLAEHFFPMKQAHYDRLRKPKADDAETLAKLLEQRRFFCAETHHAKYVLLAFSYKEDPKISKFLMERLRIEGFESALFIIRKPKWAKSGTKAEDFWGAGGIMRRVMERLHNHAIAPMILKQTVSYGYRSTTEDHYYFFLPNIESLHSFAAEYEDARTFFLALESTDFSELIHDVKIQVRIKATNVEQVPITFRQLSEGEQQLLMVLGLMRFTKSHQSLILLDEPDTHLNPHWSVNYLKDLAQVMSDNDLESPEQQTSQILMATHDPLVIASLLKEQVHLLHRDPKTGACRWTIASVNPRGLGFAGILTSEMFGFRSDLDSETLTDLDNRVRLIAKDGDPLTDQEKEEVEKIDERLADAGFSKAFSDPYYAAFVRAWGRRYSELMAVDQFLTPEKKKEVDLIASEVLKEAIAEVEKEAAE